MIFGLDFRARERGGPVTSGGLLTVPGTPMRTLDELKRAARIVFCLHGYNVKRSDGQQTLRDLALRFAQQGDAALVAVTWPGDSWARFASYPFEGRDADDTAASLARFITEHIAPLTELAFVSHSLGARVVFETIDRLPRGRFVLGQVCVMAPAIDNDSLAHEGMYREATTLTKRVAVLSSTKDVVLGRAYPLGDFLQWFMYEGERRGVALGYRGPVPHRRSPVPENVIHHPIANGLRPNGQKWNVNHGDYLPSASPKTEQLSAGQYADEVLAGFERPHYPY